MNELRERLARAEYESAHAECGCKWSEAEEKDSEWYLSLADATLAEILTTHEIVEKGGVTLYPISEAQEREQAAMAFDPDDYPIR